MRVLRHLGRLGSVRLAMLATVAVAGEPLSGAKVTLYGERDVRFSSGSRELAGTLFVPSSDKPLSAVVLVHGSGPDTRHGYRNTADRFARAGIAALCYDKQGTGESTGDWWNASLDDLADDAVASAEYLAKQPEIDPEQVGLWGISQAGWILPMAANRSDDVAFLIPVSGANVCAADQELFRIENNMRFLDYADPVVTAGLRFLRVGSDLVDSVQRGRTPLPRDFMTRIGLAVGIPVTHDVRAELRKVRQPVLAIYGDHDTLVPVEESAAILAEELKRGGHRDYTIRIFPGGDHGLWRAADTGNPLEVRQERRYVHGYWETVTRWVLSRGAQPPGEPVADVPDLQPTAITEGRHVPAWPNRAAVQVGVMTWLLGVSIWVAVSHPSVWLWRRWKGRGDSAKASLATPGGRWAWCSAVVTLVTLPALMVALFQVTDAERAPAYAGWPLVWLGLMVLAGLGVFSTLLLVLRGIQSWSRSEWTGAGRAYWWLLCATGVLFCVFAAYWQLLILPPV